MRTTTLIFTLAAGLLAAAPGSAADWITAPSYYTHDPMSGERVAQYTEVGPFYYYSRPDYMLSGYRHNRSTFQFGGSADNLHLVEEWGRPVRPYDEWRFPFRPYSVPYAAWGAPYAGLGGYGGYGYPYGYGGVAPGSYPGNLQGGGQPGVFGQGPTNTAQPWNDGHYPRYDLNDRSPYYRPYRTEQPLVP